MTGDRFLERRQVPHSNSNLKKRRRVMKIMNEFKIPFSTIVGKTVAQLIRHFLIPYSMKIERSRRMKMMLGSK